MPNLKQIISEKKKMLKELTAARTKATCASVVSSEMDVRRETEIEELEEEIRELEKAMKADRKA